MTTAGRSRAGDVLDRAPVPEPVFGAVLFDLDGVLIDSGGDVLALWGEIAADHGTELSSGDVQRHVLGCAPEHTIAALFGGLDTAARRRILARVRAAEPELGFQEMPGAGRLVGELSLAGVRLGLVTGASVGRARRVLRELGIASAFQALVSWGDVPHGKPAPDCYLLGATRIGVAAARCLVLEDAPSGVTAALAAGARPIGVSAEGAAELAAHGAHPVVPTLSELRVRRGPSVALWDGERPVAQLATS